MPPPNSLPIAGSARLTTEPSRNATNEASTATAISGRSVSVSVGIRLSDASVFLGDLPRFLGIMGVQRPLGGPNGQIRHERCHRGQRPAHRDASDAQPASLVGV